MCQAFYQKLKTHTTVLNVNFAIGHSTNVSTIVISIYDAINTTVEETVANEPKLKINFTIL